MLTSDLMIRACVILGKGVHDCGSKLSGSVHWHRNKDTQNTVLVSTRVYSGMWINLMFA